MTWRALLARTGQDLIALPRRVAEIHTIITTIRQELQTMADQITPVLQEVAEGLRGPLATSITAVLDELTAKTTRLAELEGTEATQSSAAADVRTAFADVAAKFTPVAEVPDVAPLPEPEQPAERASSVE